MPRAISIFAITASFLLIAGLILATLIQLHALTSESSELGRLENALQALEAEHRAKRIEASKIDNGLLAEKMAKLNFEQIQDFNFITAEETVASR